MTARIAYLLITIAGLQLYMSNADGTTDPAHTEETRQKNVTRSIQVKGAAVTLKIMVDTTGVEDQLPMVNQLIERYFIEWPKIAEIIEAPIADTPKELHLRFDPAIKHPGHVSGNKMVISTSHLKKHPVDCFGLFTHELTHVIQNYAGNGPVWFTEGTAEFTRFKLHPESAWAKAKLRHKDRSKPLGSYWHSTAFLMALEKHFDKAIIAPVSRLCSERKYTDEIWKSLTGQSLEQLTEAYTNGEL